MVLDFVHGKKSSVLKCALLELLFRRALTSLNDLNSTHVLFKSSVKKVCIRPGDRCVFLPSGLYDGVDVPPEQRGKCATGGKPADRSRQSEWGRGGWDPRTNVTAQLPLGKPAGRQHGPPVQVRTHAFLSSSSVWGECLNVTSLPSIFRLHEVLMDLQQQQLQQLSDWLTLTEGRIRKMETEPVAGDMEGYRAQIEQHKVRDTFDFSN